MPRAPLPIGTWGAISTWVVQTDDKARPSSTSRRPDSAITTADCVPCPRTTTPGGRLVFHVFAALGEFIREMIVQGTREGLDAARGARRGRPPAMTTEQVQHARDLLGDPDNTVSSIARLLGVSRATIYKYVPELSSPALSAAAAPLELPAAADASGTAGAADDAGAGL